MQFVYFFINEVDQKLVHPALFSYLPHGSSYPLLYTDKSLYLYFDVIIMFTVAIGEECNIL